MNVYAKFVILITKRGYLQLGYRLVMTPAENSLVSIELKHTECCCNSVEWSLYMLCLNCQNLLDNGADGKTGIDGTTRAYERFLGNCGQPLNKTLASQVQQNICQQDIKLPTFIFAAFSSNGAWYYTPSKTDAENDISQGNNNTVIKTYCSVAPKSSVPIGAIVGGIVGGRGLGQQESKSPTGNVR
ncbi:hypothetical protein BN14_08324 [Rhizoctonia solani AG-1 IB]|uniref:Uncharacterized protein n=1 Tax=Thanatephorus cucumeris (strain AG1-IB / isolate 7/3/14) TaxID=1108050 RepID=M5C585_THACB|nr:hypothetical protein BN14_08324 [Rhizoctonia solani AG-1 IB]